jgi:dihydroneopterin aldolase
MNSATPDGDYLCARLDRLEVEVALGLHPWERHPERPTRLWVDVRLYAFAPPPAQTQPLIDYDRVRDYVRTWEKRPHTPLLETLAEELIAYCFEDTHVDAVRVRLTKPDIFNEARGAGIELFRRRPPSR